MGFDFGIGATHDARMWDKDRKQNIGLRNDQWAWDEAMANSSHQREVEDLKRAGLNPILSAGGGGAPSGGSSPISVPPRAPLSVPDFMSYGIEAEKIRQEDRRIKIQDKMANAQIASNLSENEIRDLKKMLMGKGMSAAELDREGSGVMRDMIQYIKKSFNTNTQPTEMIKNMNDNNKWNMMKMNEGFTEVPLQQP